MSYLVSFSPSRLYRAIPSGSPQPRRSSSILATKLIMKINPGSTWMASDVGRGCTSRRKRLNTPRSRELWQETSSESLPLLIVNYFKEKADYETHRHGWKSFDNVRGLYIETKRLNTPRSREHWQGTSSKSLSLLVEKYSADCKTHEWPRKCMNGI